MGGQFFVRYPNGSIVSQNDSFGNPDRIVFNNGNPRIYLADGGQVDFSPLNGVEDHWVATRIVDPFGLALTVTPRNEVGPNRVTDASGRYIEFTWSGNGIVRATSSAGQSVSYALVDQIAYAPKLIARADYQDGTRALYTYSGLGQSCSVNLPLTLDDVRATSKMQYVQYTWRRDTLSTACTIDKELARDGAVVSARRGGGIIKGYGYWIDRPTGEDSGYFYDGRLLTERYDFLGHTWHYQYDGKGFLSEITDPRSYLTRLVNEPISGRPRRITHTDGSVISYTYADPSSPYHIATITDERGFVTRYERFPNNVVRRIIYPDGTEESWDDLDPFNQPRLHVLRNGAKEAFAYDAAGRLLVHWLPTYDLHLFSPSIFYTYYPDGHAWEDRVASETDPLGRVTQYDYDTVFVPFDPSGSPPGGTYAPRSGRGLVTLVTHPDGTATRYAYTSYGKVREVTDELGNVARTTYDDFQRILAKTDPEGGVTTFDYRRRSDLSSYAYTAELPTTITLPSGKLQRINYDAQDLMVSKSEGTGSETATTYFGYDPSDNLLWQVDPQGRATQYTYNGRNRMLSRIDPGGLTTSYGYDAGGNITSVTNPDGTVVRSTYDEMNRLLTKTSEIGLVTSYEYTDMGLLDVVVDPAGKRTGYDYDAMGRVTARTSPGVGNGYRVMKTYSYDAVGNLIEARDNRNVVTQYTYDVRDRETLRTYSDGTPQVATTYDAAGRVIRLVNSVSTIEFTYDRAGDVIAERQAIAGGVDATIWYTLDADRNRILLLAPDVWLAYGYTSRNQLASIHDIGSGWVSYAYNLDGQPATKTFGNGATTTFSYDASGRLSKIDESDGPDTTYGYDTRSRKISSSFGGGYMTKFFTYLDDSKLARDRRVTRFGPTLPAVTTTNDLTYDVSGNRTTTTAEGAYTTNWANQYTRVGSAETLAYDNVGNMTQRGVLNLTYDAESRLTGSPGLIVFRYDPLGRVVVVERGANVQSVVYDGEHPISTYNWLGLVEDVTYWGARGDEPYYTWRAATDQSLFYHLDALNSVVAITDLARQRLEFYDYSAFGEQRAIAPGVPWSYRTNTVEARYGFNGQVWIPELGLYDYKARAYDPRLGRFLQHDPTHLESGDPNLYRYVMNNPTNYVDSTGEIIETLWDLANVALDAASLATNIAEGNFAEAAVDVGALLLDGATVAAPGAPAVAGPAVRAGREAAEQAARAMRGVENAGDAAKAAGKAGDAASTAQHAGQAAESTSTTGKKVGDAVKETGSHASTQATGSQGTIYKVPGSATSSGKPYIGRHKGPRPQETRRSPDGRDRTKAEVVDRYDASNTREGRVKEQQAIDREGGVKSLDNKRNEIAPSKRDNFGL